MFAILHSLGMFVADLFKPRCRLEAENLFLRHQLSIALRRVAGDDPSVASLRVQSLLALEIPKAGRAPEDRSWPA